MEQPDIKGYRQLTDADARYINTIKASAEDIGRLIEHLKNQGETFDQHWVSIGATDLQKGFMALVRAVAQPTTF